jgi:nicotinamide mononucleotide adenylyltransferase
MTAPLKADVTAAERLLKAAVREAARQLRPLARPIESTQRNGASVTYMARTWTPYESDLVRERARQVLENAARSADLLLTAADKRPAKKTAKRAPRKAGS